MRILQLHTRYLEPGGEDVVVEREAATLQSGGHDVVRFTARNPPTGVGAARDVARSVHNREVAGRLGRIVGEVRPDVAHLHNTWYAMSPSVVAALRAAGVPIVMTLHNYRLTCIDATFFRDGKPCFDCLGHGPWAGVRHRCYRDSFVLSGVAAAGLAWHRRRNTWTDGVARFIAPTDALAGLAIRGGIPASKLVVKPHTCPDPGVRARPPSASNTVVFLGRAAPGKGLEVLLAAWDPLVDSGTSLTLDIIGDGPDRALLGWERAQVRWLGRLPADEAHTALLGARALVFPSTWMEPFGLVLVEAMAAGLPVIGSDVGGSRAIVDPVPRRLLGKPGDVAELSKALAALEDDRTVDSSGAHSRARYLAEYTPGADLARLESIYEGAMSN